MPDGGRVSTDSAVHQI
jgi:hypothetical protein